MVSALLPWVLIVLFWAFIILQFKRHDMLTFSGWVRNIRKEWQRQEREEG